jgi:hypothetical protein
MSRRALDRPPASPTAQLVEADRSLTELRDEWQRLFGNDVPRISRDLLILGIAYRRQENKHGGLGRATLRKLRTLANSIRTTGRIGPTPALRLKPGARLIREWGGHTHTVTVTEEGFLYGGATYPSLTTIARKITGAHWSGPRFFGLRAKAKADCNGGGNG